MIEFVKNIWNFIMSYKEEILLFITSANFAAIVTAIYNLIRSIKEKKRNTESSNNLTGTITNFNKIVSEFNTNCNKLIELSNQNSENLVKLINETNENKDTELAKINAILEVQSLVYSTIKDDDTRKLVQNILTNAKYAETKTRVALEETITNLQNQIKTYTENMNGTVKKVVEKVQETIKVDNKTIERY